MCRTPLPVAPPGYAVPWTPSARCRRRRMHAGHSSGNPLPLSVCATVRLSCAFPVAGTWPGRVRDAMAEPRIAPTPHAGIRARPDERRPRQVSRRLVAASRWVPGPTSVAACGSQCGLRTDSAQTRDGSPPSHRSAPTARDTFGHPRGRPRTSAQPREVRAGQEATCPRGGDNRRRAWTRRRVGAPRPMAGACPGEAGTSDAAGCHRSGSPRG